MQEQPNATLDQLLSEADWLNGLAVHLVRDPSAADDVVQRTWLTVLRGARDSSPRLPSGGRAARRSWLARVASHIAGHHHRDSTRRGRRSARALEAREQRGDISPMEIASRLETHRIVAQALTRLPEPVRSCLYLRYYAGLPPQEIASELGLGPGTVRSRLHRGRAMLRKELTQDGRDWSQWCQALAPFLAAGWPSAKPKAAGHGSAASPLAVASAGFLALGMVALWPSQPSSSVGDLVGEASLQAGTGLGMEPTRAERPVAVASDPQPVKETVALQQDAGEQAVLLTGTVQSELGRPVGRALILLQGPTRDYSIQSAFDGTWSLPKADPGPWRIRTHSRSHHPAWVEAEVPAVKTHHLDLVLEDLPKVAVRFEDPDGIILQGDVDERPPTRVTLGTINRPKSRKSSLLGPELKRSFYPSVIATQHAPGERLEGLEPGRLRSYGQGTWLEPGKFHRAKFPQGVQGWLLLNSRDSVWVSLVYGDRVLESRFLAEVPSELTFTVDQKQLASLNGTITFEVQDSQTQKDISKQFLRPLPRVWLNTTQVLLLGHGGSQFRIFDVPPGPHAVKVWGQDTDYEEFRWSATVAPAGDVLLPPAMRRARDPIEVSIATAAGSPLTATIWAARETAPDSMSLNWGPRVRTGKDGIAKVTSAAEGRVYLRIHVPGSEVWLGRIVDSSETKRIEVEVSEFCRLRIRRGVDQYGERYTLLDDTGFPLISESPLLEEISLMPGTYSLQRHLDGGLGPKLRLMVTGPSMIVDLSSR